MNPKSLFLPRLTRPLSIFICLLGVLFVIAASGAAPTAAAPQNAFVVNTPADTDDGQCNPQNCSLREAIHAANTNPGLDTINFGIGTCPCILYPTSTLPHITDPVIVNGYTESGASPATTQDPPILKITLRGYNLPQFSNGLVITGGDSIIKGLVINAFTGVGIWLRDKGGNSIEGNYIGMFAFGAAVSPNGRGILISHGSNNNTIGGTVASTSNLISGNTVAGIEITADGGSADGNVIMGNYIGVNVNEEKAANGTGIILRTKKNRVGPLSPQIGRNTIAGNDGAGLVIAGASATGNFVLNNSIGDLSDTNVGNGTYGVMIQDGARKNKIGKPGSANWIYENGADGVAVVGAATRQNSIRGNLIELNGGLAIDLGDDNVSLNDAHDADGGPNNMLNFPVVSSAKASTGRVKGKIKAVPNSRYTIDVAVSPLCDSTGYGEGIVVDQIKVMTGAQGDADFNLILEQSISANWFVTATVTDSKGNTSEYSKCKKVGS